MSLFGAYLSPRADDHNESACTRCLVNRRGHLCDSLKPICGYCQERSYMCDYDGKIGPHVFSMFPTNLVLNGRHLGPRKEFVANGSFGTVFRDEIEADPSDTVFSSNIVAVKVPRQRKSTSKRLLVLTIREALIWSKLSHPNIHRLRGISSDPAPEVLCLVSDWMSNENIISFLRKKVSVLTDVDILKLLSGIAGGVLYLHEQNPFIVHGDLKGNNILISSQGDALVTDFGLSHVMDDMALAVNDTSSSTHANARWSAPERLRPDLFKMTPRSSRTRESDVFALLRTFLEILTGREPFMEESNSYAVIDCVVAGKQPSRPATKDAASLLNNRMWTFMQQAWAREPPKRPSAADVVEFLSRFDGHDSPTSPEFGDGGMSAGPSATTFEMRSARPRQGVSTVAEEEDINRMDISSSQVNRAITIKTSVGSREVPMAQTLADDKKGFLHWLSCGFCF